MSEAFTGWNVAEHLRTREDARHYLDDCAEEDPGDGSPIRAAFHDIARAGSRASSPATPACAARGLGPVGGRQSQLRHGDANRQGAWDAVADYRVAGGVRPGSEISK